MKRIALGVAVVLGAGVLAGPAFGAEPLSAEERQWQLAAGPALKLVVRQNGWYRITRTKLVAAGFDARTPVQGLRLYAEGREVAMRIIGVRGGRLKADGAIEFYGVARNTYWTNARTYWLVSEPGTGRRMRVGPRSPFRGPSLRSFEFTTKTERQAQYFITNRAVDAAGDSFFAGVLRREPINETFTVLDPDPRVQGAVLEVRLQGYGDFDHQVKVELNGTEVTRYAFRDYGTVLLQLPVSMSLVRPGENRVTLSTLKGDTDFVLLDWVALRYQRLFRAVGDRLTIPLPAGRRVVVGGFTRRSIRVIDVSTPSDPEILTASVRPSGTEFIALVPSAPRPRRLLAFARAATLSPAEIVANRPSRWHEAGRGADLVMISHPSFIAALEPLRALRVQQGLEVTVVNVEELYDEFSFGDHSPEALRAFLVRTSTNWAKSPRFVLLVGDATYDPRNHIVADVPDLVPTKLRATGTMVAPSDDWFADVDDDGVPEMAVGRLPVRTPDEAGAVVAKIVRYDAQPAAGGGALLVVDRNSSGYDFESAANRIMSLLSPVMSVEAVRRSQLQANPFRATVQSRLNQGPSVVSYLGHGSVTIWNGNPLPVSAARSLVNSRLSLYAMTTCLNAYFVDPPRESLGEALLQAPSGGAFGVFASSGLVDGGQEIALGEAMATQLTQAEPRTIGEKIIRAKAAVRDLNVRKSAIYLGDPSTVIR